MNYIKSFAHFFNKYIEYFIISGITQIFCSEIKEKNIYYGLFYLTLISHRFNEIESLYCLQFSEVYPTTCDKVPQLSLLDANAAVSSFVSI